jgi:type IV pilus assembly protein PilA
MRAARGFTLIELLIAVGIIFTIAALVVPNLLRSRIHANEAAAVSNLRAINTAQTAYQVAYPTVGYADSLDKLGYPAPNAAASSSAAGLLDPVLGCGTQPCPKAGYKFAIANTGGNPAYTYALTAVPVIAGQTGTRGFCSDHEGKVKVDAAGGSNCAVALQ